MKVSQRYIKTYIKTLSAFAILMLIQMLWFTYEFGYVETTLFFSLTFGMGFCSGGMIALLVFYKRFQSQYWDFE